MKLYRKWFLLFLLFLSASTGLEWKEKSAKAAITWNTSKEQKTVKGNYTYYYYLSKNGSYSWIYRVERADGKKVSALRFPEKIGNAVVVKLGKDPVKKEEYYYNIWGDDVEPFHNYVIKNTDITALEIPDTVKKITAASFSGFCGLKSVKLPASMKKIPYALFYQCSQLTEAELPESLEEMNWEAFAKCKRLKKFKISPKAEKFHCVKGMLLYKPYKFKESFYVFYKAPAGKKKVKIPEGVETIHSGALSYTNAEKVWIPASVTYIEIDAFSESKAKRIFISKENQNYKQAKNCIYNKDGWLEVVIVPKSGKVVLPKQVKGINSADVIGKDRIAALVVPKGFKTFGIDCNYSLRFQTSGMNKIYFRSKKPPEAEDFFFVWDCTFYVPKGSKRAYKKWWYEKNLSFYQSKSDKVRFVEMKKGKH